VEESPFFHVKAPLAVTDPYLGDPINELATIRRICEECLAEEFYAAEIDTEGGKCVSIHGGSLRRKVDVVPASWVHTQEYETTKNLNEAYAKRFRGINVLEKSSRSLIQNFPFLHNADPAPIRGQSACVASFSYSRFSFSSMNIMSNSIRPELT
jgi:hypothetical protein